MAKTGERISVDVVQDAAKVLRCIGHPVRLRIIELLDQGGERNVSAIQEAVGLEQAIASQHLNLMRDKGILASRRDGVNVFYRIRDEKVVQIIGCLRACDAAASRNGGPSDRQRRG
jgi:DNA-binding transcriptional ArsR family regulator